MHMSMDDHMDEPTPQISINEEWCKGCHICVEVCPQQVLVVDQGAFLRGFHPVEVSRPEDCTACRLCELLCPDLAITVQDGRSQIQDAATNKQRAGSEKHVVGLARWTKVPSVLPPGRHFLQGDEACAEGAIAAGCDYYAGYPITPASEIMHHICQRFAQLPERVFMQMEDEIASIASVIGASWAGARAMTATSGPGLSLMLENIGYAIMTEVPCVVVDVQRAGPSTGQATRPGQGDVMQARWGAHGDYEIIVISPWSVQEAYEETVRAFNLAERFRVPVMVLMDEGVGHMRENMTVPAETPMYHRWSDPAQPPFGGEEVPSMPAFGDGARLLVTGSTHDAWGYRRTTSAEAQEKLVERFVNKILQHRDEIDRTHTHFCGEDQLDVLLVAYGFTARSALGAVRLAREAGCKAGLLRLTTLWPFAHDAVQRMATRAPLVLVPEMNRGQVLREVQRVAPHALGYHKTTGELITAGEIWAAVQEALA
jgi:2-oxoglutarate ferredoxin oxidoreductase subunit alpha